MPLAFEEHRLVVSGRLLAQMTRGHSLLVHLLKLANTVEDGQLTIEHPHHPSSCVKPLRDPTLIFFEIGYPWDYPLIGPQCPLHAHLPRHLPSVLIYISTSLSLEKIGFLPS